MTSGHAAEKRSVKSRPGGLVVERCKSLQCASAVHLGTAKSGDTAPPVKVNRVPSPAREARGGGSLEG